MERVLAPYSRALKSLHHWVISWARKKNAVVALFLLAFSESIFFPVPPDVLLIILALAIPRRSFRYAFFCLVGSVLGGMTGYLIGLKFWQVGHPLVLAYVSQETFDQIRDYFQQYEAWTIAIAGFTPIPYKLITLSAGFFQVDFSTFVLVSILSRGARFFLVAGLLYLFGRRAEAFIQRYFNLLALALVSLVIAGFLVVSLLYR